MDHEKLTTVVRCASTVVDEYIKQAYYKFTLNFKFRKETCFRFWKTRPMAWPEYRSKWIKRLTFQPIMNCPPKCLINHYRRNSAQSANKLYSWYPPINWKFDGKNIPEISITLHIPKRFRQIYTETFHAWGIHCLRKNYHLEMTLKISIWKFFVDMKNTNTAISNLNFLILAFMADNRKYWIFHSTILMFIADKQERPVS